MFSANYHTHTKRCGHATGEDEEYVQEALVHGFSYLGFSDHAMLPGYSEPYVRGDYSLFPDYVDSIRALAKKYQERITIYCGLEAESFPSYFPFYKEMLQNGVLDYLILGNHSAMNEKHEIISRFSHITSPSQLYLYKDLAIKALSSGLFSIFAHPDYFMMSIDNFDSDCRKVSKAIIECAVANDVPLEINLAGIRTGEREIGHRHRWRYPTEDFFKIVSKYRAKCIFGCDAHAPNQLNARDAEFAAVEFAQKLNLVLVDKVERIAQH